MAFEDILSAITQETDRRIAEAKDTHKQRIASMREQSERRLAQRKQEIAAQRGEKEQLMRAKAETHVALQRRNEILHKKRELLDRCYDDVKAALAKQKPAVIEKLLTHFLHNIKDKGDILPAKAHKDVLAKIADGKKFTIGKPIDAIGGFVFVSDAQEFDYTFENLIDNDLRPRTEVDVSHALFA